MKKKRTEEIKSELCSKNDTYKAYTDIAHTTHTHTLLSVVWWSE